jgi:hypothetical protein
MRRAATECACIIGVVTIGVIIAVWATVHKEEVPVGDIVVALFTVSGALVALVLPAAGIVGPFLGQKLDYSIDRVLNAPEDQEGERAKAHLAIIDRYRTAGRAAWLASVYSMAALLCSSIAFFVGKIKMGGRTLYLEHLLVGIGLGCVLVAASWFCIPAYRLYHFDVSRATTLLLDMARKRSAERSDFPARQAAGAQASPAAAEETAPEITTREPLAAAEEWAERDLGCVGVVLNGDVWL